MCVCIIGVVVCRSRRATVFRSTLRWGCGEEREEDASLLVERLGSDHDGRPVIFDLDSRSDTRLLVLHISDTAAMMERQRQTPCREGVREHRQ